MALAFDVNSGSSTGAGTSLTWSHTTTGSNLVLVVGILTADNNTDFITGVTYNSVALTRINTAITNNNRRNYLYILGNASSGANNIVISASGSTSIYASACSYTGGASSPLDANNTGTTSGTSLTTSLTTVADNCWLVGFVYAELTVSAGANTTMRGGPFNNTQMFDSNGAKTPPGSYSLITNQTTSAHMDHVIASIKVPGVVNTSPTLSMLKVG